jgi:ATP-binding cassette subfamily F protein 3
MAENMVYSANHFQISLSYITTGLIGKNGIGKTTFLKHLAAHAFPGIPAHLQILHIEQEVEASEESVLNVVLNTDVERNSLLREEKLLQKLLDATEKKPGATSLEEIEASLKEKDEFGLLEMPSEDRVDRLADIFARLQEIDADAAPAQASAILAGLGFDPETQIQPTKNFSGGWRMRIALAEALFISPDILLLDEPTNHLDLHAVLWLEEYLESWTRTIITVSHDRDFLDSICTDIIHLHNKTLIKYKGNYEDFEKQRLENIRTQVSFFCS